MAATYSPAVRSTIGAGGLNFSVRDGKRCDPAAIAACVLDFFFFDASERVIPRRSIEDAKEDEQEGTRIPPRAVTFIASPLAGRDRSRRKLSGY